MTLQGRLRAELDRRLAVTNSATSGPWTNDDPMLRDAVHAPAVDDWVADCRHEQMGPFAIHNAAHIALHDPADAIRRYEGELEVLQRHTWSDRDKWRYGITCNGCPNSAASWPCPEIRSLASRLGVSVD